MKKTKELFEFVVKKIVEEKVTKPQTVEGKEVEVTETIKNIDPVKFSLLRPTRRMHEGAEIFYAKCVNEFMSQGLMSIFLLSKRYDNDGGPFTDEENKKLKKIAERKQEISKIYFENKVKLQKKEMKEDELEKLEEDIFKEMGELQKDKDLIERPYSGIFNQTAEYKARAKVVNWWLFSLLRKWNEDAYTPYFTSKDYEENMDLLDKFETNEEPFDDAVMQSALFYISFWINGGDFTNEKSVEILNEELKDFLDYKPEEDSEEEKEKEAKRAEKIVEEIVEDSVKKEDEATTEPR